MVDHTTNPLRVDAQLVSGAKVDVVDLCYSVELNGKMKRLLKNVSFNLDSGNLCALMGPSGAGKSTLLDLIAKRKLSGTWSGEVYINDSPRSPLFSRETAYVLQDDIHISTLTVEETLLYAAWTRLDEGTSIEDRKKRVDELLELMGLSHVRNSMVGDPMTKGISGGQLKRLSIAVEIIPSQKLIFLDEPTSGLDSSIALEVMKAVRQFTTKERTCMTTIHQPSIEVFSLFDKLVLLSAGRLIYFGEASEAANYFSHPDIGYTFEGGFKNPAEFVIEISCGQRLPNGLQVAKQAEDLEVLYKSSRFYRPPLISAEASKKGWDDTNTSSSSYDSLLYATSTSTQVKMLLHRTWTAKVRDAKEIIAQVAKSMIVGVLFGAVWWDKGNPSEPLYTDGHMSSDTTAVTSLFFMMSVYSTIGNMQAIPYLCSNMVIYRRELVANAYSPLPYWFAMVFTLLPLLIAFKCIFLFIVYFMSHLPSGSYYFFYYMLISNLSNYCGYATALALAANAPSEDLALKLFPILFFFLSIFAGYAIKLDDLPVIWTVLPYISYSRWAYEGLMINEFNQFDTDDAADDSTRSGNGDVLSDFSFDNFDKNNCIWILFLFVAALTMLLLYGLQPPKNELIRVQNASDVITVLSRTSSVFKKDNLPTKNYQTGAYKKGKGHDLQEGLIVGGLEDDLVIEDPEIRYEEPLNVDYYRTTTGVTDAAIGCKVVFRDLTYKVIRKSDNAEVTLLQGVTGRINPGEMCALMGASGAGKSTLLDVLGKRKNTGVITGDITYNGVKDLKSFAYVMQDNIHIGILTVRESITYAAELRLKETMNADKKAKRVQKIIDMLGLTKVAESPLGTHEVRGISGGQLKRVSIGVEIVNLPNLMFLDEPTTGLDSSISLEVMSAVRNLANQNRTVICTIHQPSTETFALFDTLLLLAAGKIIYFGPTSDMVKYFTNSPFQFNYDEGSNPADFVVAVAGSFTNASDGRKISGAELVNYFTTTEQYNVTIEAALEQNNPPMIIKTDEDEVDPNVVKYNTSTYHQCAILIERRVKVMRRDFKEQVAQLVRNIALGLLYGSIYFQLSTGSDQSCYINRMALMFFGVMDQLVGHIDLIGLLLNERLVFYRERGAKAYGPFSYWFSLLLPIMSYQMLIVPFQTILIYFMAGLRDGHFGIYSLIIVLSNFVSFFVCGLSASVSSSTQVALSFYPAFVFFNAFYAGFIVYLPNLAGFEGKWLPYTVFYRYAFQGLVLNEFKGNDDLPKASSYLDSMGFNREFSVGGCVCMILIFLGFFAIAFYLALRFVDFEQR